MPQDKPKTVDEYIHHFPQEVQDTLTEMRAIVQGALPGATEAIKWGQPAYSYETIMIAFAAHKDHLNLYSTPSSIRALADDLTEYKTGKSSIQFPYEKPLPRKLIEKVVAYRCKEFQEHGIKWM